MSEQETANLTPLEKGRLAYQEKLARGEIKRMTPEEKSKAHPSSMRLAINSNCWDCVGQENWIKRVRECEITNCSFFELRPHKQKG